MSHFANHDQENIGVSLRREKGAMNNAPPNGGLGLRNKQQMANKQPHLVNKQHVVTKRPVLGVIDNNKPQNIASKKTFESVKAPNEKPQKHVVAAATVNRSTHVIDKLSKPPVPVVPVEQFEAFKVYEDDEQSHHKLDLDVVSPSKDSNSGDDLDDSLDILSGTAMSIEKSHPNKENNESLSAVVKSTRCKDLFFEMGEYRSDIFIYLKQLEKQSRPKAGYMKKQPDITYSMRTILVDWLVEVAEEYKLHTETLYFAVNYIDRFLSYMSVVRSKLQLVGTAAMFIAAKYEEIFPPDVGEFVYITDDTYTKRQVTRMEILILKILDFDLSVPTPYTFITAICTQHRLPEKVMYLAMYLSELALLETEPLLETLPSVMASASVALALHTVSQLYWTKELVAYTGYDLNDLRKSILFLDDMFDRADKLQQQAIQEKYRSGKYLHVSSMCRNSAPIKFN